MSTADWIVLVLTLGAVLTFGVYKGRGEKNMHHYFKSSNSMPWFIILLSIMGTQASAITFLSAPGQAYTDGMRFVQYYFGLPLAMVVLCITFVPIFHKLKVYTAYEFLETRFDLKTRSLAAILFLVQRGLSTGISIYAPSIILSSLLGWNIYLTNLFMGGLLIIYTVSGGTRAVSYTHVQQLIVVLVGMFLAGYMVVRLLPDDIGFTDALKISGAMGKLNIIDTRLEPGNAEWWKERYNLWSGLIGGFFLALSYFGTDQSQVSRYLTARSVKESKMGLLMNGFVKVPMQFLILLIGALVFSFYTFYSAPVFFNKMQMVKVEQSSYASEFQKGKKSYDSLSLLKQKYTRQLVNAWDVNNDAEAGLILSRLKEVETRSQEVRTEAKSIIQMSDKLADTNDTNYIFLHFVLQHLPAGLIGLLLAVIFLSAWGSIAAALNALASSTIVDIYQRNWVTDQTEKHYYHASRWVTLFWGLFCIAVAMFAGKLGSLIEAVNILGSLFYGTILGIFLVAFYMKQVKGGSVFWAAVAAEIIVIAVYWSDVISFLWLNAIGCLLVMALAWGLQRLRPRMQDSTH